MEGLFAVVAIIGIILKIVGAANKSKNNDRNKKPTNNTYTTSRTKTYTHPSQQAKPKGYTYTQPDSDRRDTSPSDDMKRFLEEIRGTLTTTGEKAEKWLSMPSEPSSIPTLVTHDDGSKTSVLSRAKTDEGLCPPEHDALHEKPLTPAASPILVNALGDSSHARLHSYSGAAVSKKRSSVLDIKDARKGIMWSQILARPRFGVPPRNR